MQRSYYYHIDMLIHIIRSGPLQMFFQTIALKKLCKIHRKTPVPESHLIKLQAKKLVKFTRTSVPESH